LIETVIVVVPVHDFFFSLAVVVFPLIPHIKKLKKGAKIKIARDKETIG
jgi:hypothetical protein